MLVFRQGDVLIRQRKAERPESATPIARDGAAVILAYGEVTGHSHQILERDVTFWLPEGLSGVRILDVPTGATVRHDEHDPIELPAGTYDVFIQTEYSPQELRQVLD